jgi:hypothetical protein
MRGRSNGQFQVVQRIPADVFAARLAVGDVDGDGARDVAWVEGAGGTSIVVRLRDRYLRFEPAASTTMTVDPGPSWLLLADVNVDGRADLIYGYADRTTAEVRLSRNEGGFADPIVSDLGMAFFETPTLIDVDVDLAPDLVALQAVGPYDPVFPIGGAPAIAAGNADGSFRPAHVILPSDVVPNLGDMVTGGLLATNFDADPSIDLVIAYSEGTRGQGPLLFNVGHCLEPRR